MIKRLLLTLAILAGLAAPAVASQGSGCLPTTGTVSGLTLVTRMNAALDALISTNSGSVAPVTACSGASLTGQLWVDTSTTPNVLKVYDGTSWLPIGTIDAVSHVWTPPVGGGTNSLVAAATTDLGSVPQAYVAITGSTGITAFGTSATVGTLKFVSFTGTPAVSYNATSLILPTAATITAQAGDKALFVYLGGGNWAAMSWIRADGTALATTAVFGSQISFTGIITPTALASTTNDWAPTGLATASTIRASGSVDVSITGITAQPAGTILILNNVGSTILTLSDASGSSSAANRFSFGADVLLGPSQSIVLRYDSTLSRWSGAATYIRTASQSEATTGTSDTTYMTPHRTAQAIAALASSAGTDYQAFTTNGTWAKPSGVTASSMAFIQCWAAGGGGGSGTFSGGGGGGAYKELWLLVSAMGSTETVTVPAGGAVGTVGSNGTVGSLITCYGGGAGFNGGGGGGGGGMSSAGSNGSSGAGGAGGNPGRGGGGSGCGTGGGTAATAGGGGGGTGCSGTTVSAGGGDGSIWGGAGGGGGNVNVASPNGGSAVWGGGGGGGTNIGNGGSSVYAGAGGANTVAGSAPSGGGGRNAIGGRAEIRITTFK